jgi:hypothetical protein
LVDFTDRQSEEGPWRWNPRWTGLGFLFVAAGMGLLFGFSKAGTEKTAEGIVATVEVERRNRRMGVEITLQDSQVLWVNCASACSQASLRQRYSQLMPGSRISYLYFNSDRLLSDERNPIQITSGDRIVLPRSTGLEQRRKGQGGILTAAFVMAGLGLVLLLQRT